MLHVSSLLPAALWCSDCPFVLVLGDTTSPLHGHFGLCDRPPTSSHQDPSSSSDYSCYICPILSCWGTVVFFSFPVCSAGPFPLFPPPRVWRTSAPRSAPGRWLTLALLLLSLVTCHILGQTSDLQAELVHRIYKLSSPSLDCLEPWNQQ